ncbi:MAG: type IV secretory system conjugative DNA transfer family protein, partial [Oscillospiraceae bacterium]
MLLVSKGYENNCLDKLNMYSVYSFFLEYGVKNETVGTKQVNALDKLFQELPVGHPAKLSYATSNFATGEMRSSIFSTLASNIEIFADTGIAKLTSGNEIDFSDLINPEKPCAIFMVLPDEKVNRHVIASLFINQCYSALVDLAGNYPQQKLPQRIQFILDEFGNMVRIPSMDVKMTVCLGRNILFNLFVQDFNQLSSKYGDTSKTVRSNCGKLIYFNCMDKETNDYISAILGSKTVEYETFSGNLNESLSHKNLSIKGRQLMTGAELGVLKMGEAVIKRQRGYPMKTKFEPFFKLKLPLTKISEIISVRSFSLNQLLFPFDIFEKEAEEENAAISPEEIA